MDSHRLTRRALVGRAASAVAVGVALDPASNASAAPHGDLVVGRLESVKGVRSGVLSVAGEGSVPVTLDPAAFVAHGTDGIVDGLTTFVPGEEVAVRGATSERGIAAIEFQSVYTSATGIVTAAGPEYVLVTSSGRRARVPQEVAQRGAPSGVRSGATYQITIWTDPVTGEATAVDLTAGN